jgi:hypothetical protein
VEVQLHTLTLALHGDEWSDSRPGRFTPSKRAPGTHWIGGWVGSRAGLDAVVKRRIPSRYWDSNPPIISQWPSATSRSCPGSFSNSTCECKLKYPNHVFHWKFTDFSSVRFSFYIFLWQLLISMSQLPPDFSDTNSLVSIVSRVRAGRPRFDSRQV